MSVPLDRDVDEDSDSLVRRVEGELARRAGFTRASLAGDPWREHLFGLGVVSQELLEEAGSLQEELDRARFARASIDFVSLRTRTERWLDAVRAALDPARSDDS